MGEIARRRGSRDLWISRGHVWAATALVGILVLLAFLVGSAVGRRQASGASVSEVGRNAAGDDALVDLLARVETSGLPGGGATTLTYPEALGGAEARTEAPGGVVAGMAASLAIVPTAPNVALPGLGAPPTAGVGVLVARTTVPDRAQVHLETLVGANLPLWARVVRGGGVDVYEVGFGPWADRRTGRAALRGSTSSSVPLDPDWVDFTP